MRTWLLGLAHDVWFALSISAAVTLILAGCLVVAFVPRQWFGSALMSPRPLICEYVQIPWDKSGADLCLMPDGVRCLFSRSGQRTTCYTIQGATDVR
jgi:hypothetical protein